ncbi:Aldo/keto reductase [Mycena floridula]|nr:Aldo/keto reductase [Mycena floridula]
MLPRIIYGTAWKKDRTASLVVKAVLQGFRAIDTAGQPKHYNEPLVGEALETLYKDHGLKREDIFLQTKFTSISGQDTSQPLPYDPSDSITQQIQSSFEKSLKNLRTTYLDSYILHSPLRTLEGTLEAWRTLMSLQDSGKVRMIGVSNTYEVSTLEALSRERKVQVVQNRWFEGNQWDTGVLKYCRANEIVYQSFWTLTGSPSLLSHAESSAAAAKCTPAQAVYRFAQLEGIVPLSGTTNETHMKEAVAAENVELKDVDRIRRFVEQ